MRRNTLAFRLPGFFRLKTKYLPRQAWETLSGGRLNATRAFPADIHGFRLAQGSVVDFCVPETAGAKHLYLQNDGEAQPFEAGEICSDSCPRLRCASALG